MISDGKISGVRLNLKTLGIGNGVIDAARQYPYVSDSAGQRCKIKVLF